MKRDAVLSHIRDAMERIGTYIAGGKASFKQDAKTQAAVAREVEIIGEAVKHLSTERRGKHTDVPWKRMEGMRDVIIHDYMEVDEELLWDVAFNEIPKLKNRVETILSGLPEK